MTLHRPAVVQGAIYAAVISGAAGLLQLLDASQGWRGLLFLVILFGFFFGGFVAGRGRAGEASKHGAAAAGLAFAIVQGTAAVRRLVIGETVSVVGVVFGLLTAAVCGTLGGMLATRSPGPEAVRRLGRDR